MGYKYQTADPLIYGMLKEFAKENRMHQTEAERCLWTELRKKHTGYTFKRQHIIGDYIVDFVCLDYKLIIEVDGGYHSQPEQIRIDSLRSNWLERNGYTLIRFNNDDIIGNIEVILTQIHTKLNEINGQ